MDFPIGARTEDQRRTIQTLLSRALENGEVIQVIAVIAAASNEDGSVDGPALLFARMDVGPAAHLPLPERLDCGFISVVAETWNVDQVGQFISGLNGGAFVIAGHKIPPKTFDQSHWSGRRYGTSRFNDYGAWPCSVADAALKWPADSRLHRGVTAKDGRRFADAADLVTAVSKIKGMHHGIDWRRDHFLVVFHESRGRFLSIHHAEGAIECRLEGPALSRLKVVGRLVVGDEVARPAIQAEAKVLIPIERPPTGGELMLVDGGDDVDEKKVPDELDGTLSSDKPKATSATPQVTEPFETLYRSLSGSHGTSAQEGSGEGGRAERTTSGDMAQASDKYVSPHPVTDEFTTSVYPENSEFVRSQPEPKTRNVSYWSLGLPSKVDALIVTATNVELSACLQLLKPLRGDAIHATTHGLSTYYIGRYGAVVSAVVKCEMGNAGPDAAGEVIGDGILKWNPKVAIMCGIAFAQPMQDVIIGTVLVARSIIPYGSQRINADGSRTPRGQSGNPGLVVRS